jgi:hypothetical protein
MGNIYTQSILGVKKHKITQDGQRKYTINTWREQAQKDVVRLELFCVCSRQVLIVYICCPSWVILFLLTPSTDCVYVLPFLSYLIDTRREKTQNNSRRTTQIHNQYLAWTSTKRRATHIHNQYLAWTELFGVCSRLVGLELFCVCSRQVLIVYMCCPSWVMLCLFTSSIDCVYALPVHICIINTWREQTQNNSKRETQIHNQY